MKEKRPFTIKEQLFIDEIMFDFNATGAARRAGYKVPEASGKENLQKPLIRAEINRRIDKKNQDNKLERERIGRELECIAFARMTDHVSFVDGKLKVRNTEELTDAQVAAVESYSYKSGQFGPSMTVKLHDKLQAMIAWAKFKGIKLEEQDVKNTEKALETGVKLYTPTDYLEFLKAKQATDAANASSKKEIPAAP